MSMDPELKAKWVKALRSGQYLQGDGALFLEIEGEPRFCCLGVLWDIQKSAFYEGIRSIEMETSCLPVEAAAGLTEDEMDHLATLNDGFSFEGGLKRHTFPELADYIEENL